LKRRLYNILENFEPSLMNFKKDAQDKIYGTFRELLLFIWGVFVYSDFNLEILKKGYIYFFFPWAVLFTLFSLLIYIEQKIGF